MIRKLASGKYRLYSRKKESEDWPPPQSRHVFNPDSGREARASRPVLQTALTPSRIGGRCGEPPGTGQNYHRYQAETEDDIVPGYATTDARCGTRGTFFLRSARRAIVCGCQMSRSSR